MEWLGRSPSDSKVSGDNLKKILFYLIKQRGESYDETVYKLSITCRMGVRYVKDYLLGLEAWKLMRTYLNGQTKVWEWIGCYNDD